MTETSFSDAHRKTDARAEARSKSIGIDDEHGYREENLLECFHDRLLGYFRSIDNPHGSLPGQVDDFVTNTPNEEIANPALPATPDNNGAVFASGRLGGDGGGTTVGAFHDTAGHPAFIDTVGGQVVDRLLEGLLHAGRRRFDAFLRREHAADAR